MTGIVGGGLGEAGLAGEDELRGRGGDEIDDGGRDEQATAGNAKDRSRRPG